ncbi:MAG: hypothetical protein Q8P00_00320, partial [Dehalococcoidia bacterium]|nr:hypothetical protein [Dehalococcoidia bacterium]
SVVASLWAAAGPATTGAGAGLGQARIDARSTEAKARRAAGQILGNRRPEWRSQRPHPVPWGDFTLYNIAFL